MTAAGCGVSRFHAQFPSRPSRIVRRQPTTFPLAAKLLSLSLGSIEEKLAALEEAG